MKKLYAAALALSVVFADCGARAAGIAGSVTHTQNAVAFCEQAKRAHVPCYELDCDSARPFGQMMDDALSCLEEGLSDEDIARHVRIITDRLRELDEISQRIDTKEKIVLNANPLFPLKGIPFEWMGLEDSIILGLRNRPPARHVPLGWSNEQISIMAQGMARDTFGRVKRLAILTANINSSHRYEQVLDMEIERLNIMVKYAEGGPGQTCLEFAVVDKNGRSFILPAGEKAREGDKMIVADRSVCSGVSWILDGSSGLRLSVQGGSSRPCVYTNSAKLKLFAESCARLALAGGHPLVLSPSPLRPNYE